MDDLVRGLVAMIDAEHTGPINLGNPHEQTVAELATLILKLTGSSSVIEWHRLLQGDPCRRKPDIGQARELLGRASQVGVEEGLAQTIAWFRTHSLHGAAAAVAGPQDEGYGFVVDLLLSA